MVFIRIKVPRTQTELSHIKSGHKKEETHISAYFYKMETMIMFITTNKWTPLGLVISFNSGNRLNTVFIDSLGPMPQ